MNIIANYLIREFFKILGLCFSGIFLVFLVVDFFEKMRRYARYEPTLEAMLTYFLLRLPQMVLDIAPLVVVIAVTLTLGMLSRRNELIAMKGMGISSLRIAMPFLTISFLISLLLLITNLSVIPTLKKETEYVKHFQIRKKPPTVFFRQSRIWLQADPTTFMNVQLADSQKSTLFGVNLYKLNKDYSLRESIQAEEIRYQDSKWILSEGFRRTFHPDGSIRVDTLKDTVIPLHRRPKDFIEISKETKGMTFGELSDYVGKLNQSELPTHRYRVDLYTKTALPFIGFVFAMVGTPIALRQGLKQGISRSVGLALVMAVIYWVVFSFSVTLGYGEVIPPLISAWLPNALFLIAGFFLMKRMS